MRTLKEHRLAAKESQQKVADLLGVDRTTYSKWETGGSEPSFAMLEKMAAHWGTTAAELMGSDTKKEPAPKEGDGLDSLDLQLLESFKKLSPEYKKMLLAQIQVAGQFGQG